MAPVYDPCLMAHAGLLSQKKIACAAHLGSLGQAPPLQIRLSPPWSVQKISLAIPKVVVMKMHSTVPFRTDCSLAVTTVRNTSYVIKGIQGKLKKLEHLILSFPLVIFVSKCLPNHYIT